MFQMVTEQNLRDLGVTADLSWSLHIANAVSKATSKAYWILSVFKTTDKGEISDDDPLQVPCL